MNTHCLLINTQACLHVPKSPWEGWWVGTLLGWFCVSEILLEELGPHVYFIITREPKQRTGSLTNPHICSSDPNCTTSILFSCPSQSFSVFVRFSDLNDLWVTCISAACVDFFSFFLFLIFALLPRFRRKGQGEHWAEGSIIRPRLPDWTVGPVSLRQEECSQPEPHLSSGVGYHRRLRQQHQHCQQPRVGTQWWWVLHVLSTASLRVGTECNNHTLPQ